MQVAVWHGKSHSIPFSSYTLLASIYCNESLVKFKSSGFWYTINTEPSLALLLDTLFLSFVMETMQLWKFITVPFKCSSISQME